MPLSESPWSTTAALRLFALCYHVIAISQEGNSHLHLCLFPGGRGGEVIPLSHSFLFFFPSSRATGHHVVRLAERRPITQHYVAMTKQESEPSYPLHAGVPIPPPQPLNQQYNVTGRWTFPGETPSCRSYSTGGGRILFTDLSRTQKINSQKKPKTPKQNNYNQHRLVLYQTKAPSWCSSDKKNASIDLK